MLPLLAAVAVVLVVAVPELLRRIIGSFFIPRRTVPSRPRQEELGRSLLALAAPLLVAFWVCLSGPLSTARLYHHTHSSFRRDIQAVSVGFSSAIRFQSEGNPFFASLSRLATIIKRFLAALYIFAFMEACLFGILIVKYTQVQSRLSKFRTLRATWTFVGKALLPGISPWHVILSPFLADDPKSTVIVDVLTTDGRLYKGRITQYFEALDGTLLGFFVAEPKRFDLDAYRAAKELSSKPNKERYWKVVPGKSLYFFADKIVNLNISHEPSLKSRDDKEYLARQIAEILKRQPDTFTIGIEISPQKRRPKQKSGVGTQPIDDSH